MRPLPSQGSGSGSGRGAKKEISRFVSYQRTHEPKGDRSTTVQDLIAQQRTVPKREMDRAFARVAAQVDGSEISPFTVEYVRRFCYDILSAVNALPAAKRFYILETVNFLSGKTGIAHLIQILLLSDRKVRRGMAAVMLTTFRSTSRVIQTLSRRSEIFSPVNGESEKGELYAFQSDLSRRLLKLFRPESIEPRAKELGIDESLPVDLLQGILGNSPASELTPLLIDDDDSLVINQVDYLSLLQTHPALSIYAEKRNEFLKWFLIHDLRERSIAGVEPADLSRIAAGFLSVNAQLKPGGDLIHSLITESRFRIPKTVKAEYEFLNDLAPSTLDDVIGRIRATLRQLAAPDADVDSIFREVRYLSEDQSPLAQMEAGVMAMVNRGVITMNDLMLGLVEPFRDVQEKRAAREMELADIILEAIGMGAGTNAEEEGILPKDATLDSMLKECFPVITDKTGYRGGSGKTIYKDFLDSGRVFQNDERAIHHFKKCMGVLFRHFHTTSKENPVAVLRQPNPNDPSDTLDEHYLAFQLPDLGQRDLKGQPLLLCVGTAHFPRKRADVPYVSDGEDPREALVDPYVFLLVGSTTAQGAGRAVSRKIEGEGKTFNEVRVLDSNLPTIYESLHLVLHHLPDTGDYWRDRDVQWCIKFLRNHVGQASGKTSRR